MDDKNTEIWKIGYKNMEILTTTYNKRKQIEQLQDEFMKFSWRGFDSFENFGAFIINEKKGSLKFYGTPSFSNEYTKPQFDAAGGQLIGVNTERKSISFTIGVYWISIEHLRYLMDWLNPYTVSFLSFNFDPKYRYNVKLSKISEGTRWVVGKEEDKLMYYTELQLSFEIQGAQCAKGYNSYEWGYDKNNKNKWKLSYDSDNELNVLTISLNKNNDFVPSDLQTPIEVTSMFDIYTKNTSEINSNIFYKISLYAEWGEQSPIMLYEVNLKNLTHTELKYIEDKKGSYIKDGEVYILDSVTRYDLIDGKYVVSETGSYIKNDEEYIIDTRKRYIRTNPLQTISIKYNSEDGLLYLQEGTTDEVLSLLVTSDSGQRIVDSFISNKFFLPGKFDIYDFYTTGDVSLKLSVKKYSENGSTIPEEFFDKMIGGGSIIVCYPRTNLI